MLVIAHRGASQEAIENSFEAFELAVESGAKRIELDVQLTADHELIIMHDDTITRTCNRWGVVHKLTRSELEHIQLLNGEPIPFLEQVIDRFARRIELNIELKTPSVLAAEKVAQMTHQHELQHQVIISSFYRQPMEYLAAHHQSIPRACLWGGMFSWPDIAHMAPPVFMDLAKTGIFHPWVELVTPSLVEQAKSRNWIIYPFVSGGENPRDNEELWDYLYALEVDGLCTNHPREMNLWLEKVRHEEQQFKNPKWTLGQINL